MTEPRFALVASATEDAQEACARLNRRYATVPPQEAEVIVALGGDGFVLETLHDYITKDIPIYGMNCGTVGFLMNRFDEEDLPARLAAAQAEVLHPLRMTATCRDGKDEEAVAINEVALFRESRQAAKVRIHVDGVTRMDELICDGVLLSTPAGSTAYNLSAHGPIVPIGAPLLALTPISAFRPRRWRGALLRDSVTVRFDVLEANKRPVSATADFTEIREVVSVAVHEDESLELKILFDPDHNLDERIVKEQFLA
ncbi:MAG: NAD kinase [Pseudomonadota bacterium]